VIFQFLVMRDTCGNVVLQRIWARRCVDVRWWLIDWEGFCVVRLNLSVHADWRMCIMGLRDRRLALVVANVADWNGGVVICGLQLKCMHSRCIRILLIANSGRDAIELQAGASGTGPGVRCCRIAFDLPSSTSFAGSHDLQSLVAVVLVNEYIVCSASVSMSSGPYKECAYFAVGVRRAQEVM
jgi:hypothetical protein